MNKCTHQVVLACTGYSGSAFFVVLRRYCSGGVTACQSNLVAKCNKVEDIKFAAFNLFNGCAHLQDKQRNAAKYAAKSCAVAFHCMTMSGFNGMECLKQFLSWCSRWIYSQDLSKIESHSNPGLVMNSISLGAFVLDPHHLEL